MIEELGGDEATLPVRNSFSQANENGRYAYSFFGSSADCMPPAAGRWTSGRSLDGKGEFSVVQNRPLGDVPDFGPAKPHSGAETAQIA